MGQLEYEVNALKELEDNATPDAQRLKKLKHRWETVARQIESKVRAHNGLTYRQPSARSRGASRRCGTSTSWTTWWRRWRRTTSRWTPTSRP